MRIYKTTKGYYYKVYNNNNKKRISKTEYLRRKKTESLKLNGGGNKWFEYISVNNNVRYVRYVRYDIGKGQENHRNHKILQVETVRPPGITISESISNISRPRWNLLLNELELIVKKNDNVIEMGRIERIERTKLLIYPGKLIFTSFYKHINDKLVITPSIDKNATKMTVFADFIDTYRRLYPVHLLSGESGEEIEFTLGDRIGGGNYGIIYKIENTDICIKFMLLQKINNNTNAIENNSKMNEYLNIKDETLLPLKQLYMDNDKSTYMNESQSRIRVYLMLKCKYDLHIASRYPIINKRYIVWEPSPLKNILNSLMIQFSKLQEYYENKTVESGLIEIGDNHPKINPVQLFDLKPENCALDIRRIVQTYLIDLDGYHIIHTNNVRNGLWISSFPPIEFYKDKDLADGKRIKPIDFADIILIHPNYYKLGLHSSWMLGILIYQMINLYCNLPSSKSVKFFDFLNHNDDRLRNCTHDNNLFTSLDNFVESLDEPFKSEWMDVPDGSDKSFLDEIKSCLYFDDGEYDGRHLTSYSLKYNHDNLNNVNNFNNMNNNGRVNNGKILSPPINGQQSEQYKLEHRRPFYNEDGSLNFF